MPNTMQAAGQAKAKADGRPRPPHRSLLKLKGCQVKIAAGGGTAAASVPSPPDLRAAEGPQHDMELDSKKLGWRSPSRPFGSFEVGRCWALRSPAPSMLVCEEK